MKKIVYILFLLLFSFNAYAELKYVPPQGFEDYLIPNTQLTLFAPKHVGLTSTPVPALFFATAVIGKDIQLTINEPTSANPLLKTVLKAPPRPGIFGFGLADFKVELKEGIEYEWILRIQTDPKQPSADIVSTGAIKFVPMTKELTEKVNKVKGEELHKVYAENGYWYDAVDCANILVDRESEKKKEK